MGHEVDYKKLYEDALERAKAYHRNELSGTRREMTEYIFPELSESEDEKISRIIKLALIASEEDLSDFYKTHKITRKECTDWLEREKEQKPNQYVLCDTVKEKIRSYISNHFITDEVVKTDVNSVVKAMEEGARLGKEEEHVSKELITQYLSKRLKELWNSSSAQDDHDEYYKNPVVRELKTIAAMIN